MRLNITVDGRTYEVDVEVSEPEQRPVPQLTGGHVRMPAAPAAAPVAARAAADDGPVADEAKVCRSPVSGVVTKAVAQPGQSMQVGDVLLVLEAMKMETNITAPVAAKVAKVNAAVGDAVRSGQVLVVFE
jgi:methylmalonyl-CoA carboxyltransferase small subunit